MNTNSTSAPLNKKLCYTYLGLLFWLPIPLGSDHTWAMSIAWVWCFIIAGIVVIHQLRQPAPLPSAFRTARFALTLLVLNIIWLLIQIVPMPVEWLQTISPAAANLYILAGVNHAPISLDTESTFSMIQVATYLFIFFCLTLYLIDSKQKIKWLIYTVLISAMIQVIYGAMMILTGIEHSFFISKAAIHSHIGSATGTFMNRDHLAGYLEMALALGIGFMLSMLSSSGLTQNWKSRIRGWLDLLFSPKARLRLFLVLLCIGLVLTHSRGGNIGFFVGLGLAGVLFLIFARKKPRTTVIFLTSLIVLDIVIIGSWVGVSKVMTRLENTSIQTEQRDDAYLATLPMIEDYFITGTGAGTYFETFPAYKGPNLPLYWIHAHNDYLEIFAEQGVIGFTLLSAFVLYSLFISIQTLRKRQSSFVIGLSFASIMGTISLLIHSAVDFNLQVLANSSMFMVILAIPFICRHLRVENRS